MDRIIDQTRLSKSTGSTSVLSWIVGINVLFFLLLRLFAACSIFTGDRTFEVHALSMVELPADLHILVSYPWTLITYMFSQFDLFHFLFNMLWLYWFGHLFLERFNQSRFLSLYISGGLAGAVAFITAANFLSFIPTTYALIGSSAAVLAIVAATALLMPEKKVGLMFAGGIRIKWIALIMVVMDLINIGFDNTGGHIAHIGGFLVGAGVAIHMRNLGRRYKEELSENLTSDNKRIDFLLDKIRQSGYGSLTRKERRILFDLSRKAK